MSGCGQIIADKEIALPGKAPTLSVVIPCFNEVDNLDELLNTLIAVFPIDGDIAVEFIIVDDGSDDGGKQKLKGLLDYDHRLQMVDLDHRSGQTRALWAGLQIARGEWVAHLDCDLQNDPADLPAMLKKGIVEGLDAVLGYRARRDDDFGRRFSSRFANTVRRLFLHDTIRDIGCSTRVVRREVLLDLEPIPNQHRYLPALIERSGRRIVQVPTRHYSRRHGTSKYGNLSRGLEGLRDLPRVAAYLRSRETRSKGGAVG